MNFSFPVSAAAVSALSRLQPLNCSCRLFFAIDHFFLKAALFLHCVCCVVFILRFQLFVTNFCFFVTRFCFFGDFFHLSLFCGTDRKLTQELIEMVKVGSPLVPIQLITSSREVTLSYLLPLHDVP